MAKRMPQSVNTAVRDYIKVLRKEIPVEKAVVFGSYAKGESGTDSDIDLAIVSAKFGRDPHEDGKYLMRKLWEVGYSNIGPVGYSPKAFNSSEPSPLLEAIKKEGAEVKI